MALWALASLLGALAAMAARWAWRRLRRHQRVGWAMAPVFLSLLFGACPHQSTSEITVYGYDAGGRVVSALVGTGASGAARPQYAYAYDAASNPVSIRSGGVTQPIAYTLTNALAAGTYDANGSPTTLDATTYQWGVTGRLAAVSKGGTDSALTYDGLGRLVRIVDKQGSTVVADRAFLWCGTERCLERDNIQPGSPIVKRYYAQGVSARGKAYYYVGDALGSVRQLIDGSEQVHAQYGYDPYGQRTKVSGDVDSDIGYAGYFHHESSALDFALYRAYDPQRARWLNRDPIGEQGGTNLYGYADGNPVNQSDPTGLCPWCAGALIDGGLGAGADLGYQRYKNGGQFRCVNWGSFYTLRVPNSVAAQMWRTPMLDAIGPARSAEGAVLDLINAQGNIDALMANAVP